MEELNCESAFTEKCLFLSIYHMTFMKNVTLYEPNQGG